jgi:hypothetical protein
MNALRPAFAALLMLLAAPLFAQVGDQAGLWALRAEGRVLAVLTLRRDGATPGGWTGQWTRPERLTISSAHAAFDIRGPVIDRPILSAISRGDMIDLTIQRRVPSETPDVFTFRLLSPNVAEFGLKDAPITPLELSRAEPGTAVAADWDPTRHYALTASSSGTNAEMTAIFRADQADRQPRVPAADREAVAARDAVRRTRTMALLDSGGLRSGTDYLHAAFVFQHGPHANDTLLAHTLAVIAVARGRSDATWIAAATLDRYLQRIGQPQIYGTQYSVPDGRPATQEPYDRNLVSDALRQALGVETQAEQENQRAAHDSGRAVAPPR